MILRNRFRNYWNLVSSTTASGEKLVSPPWRFDFQNIDIFHENPLRRNLALRELFYIFAWSFLFLGVIFSSLRIVGVAGFVMLTYSHWLYRTVWRQLSHVEVKSFDHPKNVEVGSQFEVGLKIFNGGKTTINLLALHIHFSGSSEPNAIKTLNDLRPGEARDLRISFLADLNMGPHYLGPLHVTVSDFMGAHELTARKDVRGEMILRPQILPVAFLETRQANYGMVPGVIDIPVSGHSPTFLGLRPWRDGDSIRQIDWKRSMRTQEIVVKEFERQSSTDVTLVLDMYHQAHSAFAEYSSIEMAKTVTISVANTLLRRQMRLQTLVGDKWLPLGTGNKQLDTVYKYTVESRLVREPVHECLKEHLDTIPSASMAVFVITDFTLLRTEFLEILMRLKDREVELIGVMIEGIAYSERVSREAQLKQAASHFLAHALTIDKNGEKNAAACHRLFDALIPLKPGDDIAQKFREVA